jgi:hypothetical protein
MEASCKVIILPTAARFAHDALEAEPSREKTSRVEEESLLRKAKAVLDQMEAEWELDHCAVELREQFHLLRYYLERLS